MKIIMENEMKEFLAEEEKKLYQDYIKQMTPKHKLGTQMIRAFLVGGIICIIGQGILNYGINMLGMDGETAGSFCSLVLIGISVLLTGFNIYPSITKYGGAGSLVPITGFANSVAAPALDFKKEGQIFGIGCKIFTIAGPVILYGIVCSWVLGVFYYVAQCIGFI